MVATIAHACRSSRQSKEKGEYEVEDRPSSSGQLGHGYKQVQTKGSGSARDEKSRKGVGGKEERAR